MPKPLARRAPAPRFLLVALRKLGALAVLTAFVAASFAAGRTYLWCSMMDAVVPTCCCGGDDAAASSDSNAPAVRAACCEQLAEPALPSTRLGAPVAAIPPPQLTLLTLASPLPPAPSFAFAAPPLRGPPPPAAARHGPARASPRSASDTCALLQVFRC